MQLEDEKVEDIRGRLPTGSRCAMRMVSDLHYFATLCELPRMYSNERALGTSKTRVACRSVMRCNAVGYAELSGSIAQYQGSAQEISTASRLETDKWCDNAESPCRWSSHPAPLRDERSGKNDAEKALPT